MINFIPPRFLDDVTLLDEYSYSATLFKRVGKFLTTGLPLDCPKTFRQYQPWLFLRHEMLESELEEREIEYVKTELDPNEIVSGSSDFPITVGMVVNSCEQLMKFWEANMDVIEDGDFIEQLSLTIPADMLSELEWNLSIYREEYFDL